MPRARHRGFDRMHRIADMIQRSMACILRTNVSDERFRFVSITSVTVTRDLGYAKIYVDLLEEDTTKVKQIIDALNHAEKYLRYTLAHTIDLRIVPELQFIYDESPLQGFKMISLINSALKKSDRDA